MERSLIKELMQTHKKICNSLVTGIAVLFAICLLNIAHFPKDVLLVCGTYILVRIYQNRYSTLAMQICDSVLAVLIYIGTKSIFNIQLDAGKTIYEKGLLVVMAGIPVFITPAVLAMIKSIVSTIKHKIRKITYSFDAARITSHLPFSQEELVELGISCRSDYIKLLYMAVNTVSTREAVSAERIADIVCDTRGQEICDILNHFDTNHEKKDIFLLYADKDFVNKCLDNVGIKDADSRHYTAYLVLKGCCGDKLSVNDIKKLIKAFIIWR